MLGLDLNVMRLRTPPLDGDEQRSQETGEGTSPWPSEIDPKNPTGVERDRPVPGSSERKLPEAMFFEGGAAAGLRSGDQPLTTEEQERLGSTGRALAKEWGPHFGPAA